jgi:hypothetical protein
MLRNFTAALLATTLIACPAFAAQPSGSTGSPPATAAGPNAQTTAKQTNTTMPVKTVKHARTHARHHVARGKVGPMKLAKHFKATKTHRGHVAHIAKPGKVAKSNKSSA